MKFKRPSSVAAYHQRNLKIIVHKAILNNYIQTGAVHIKQSLQSGLNTTQLKTEQAPKKHYQVPFFRLVDPFDYDCVLQNL